MKVLARVFRSCCMSCTGSPSPASPYLNVALGSPTTAGRLLSTADVAGAPAGIALQNIDDMLAGLAPFGVDGV